VSRPVRRMLVVLDDCGPGDALVVDFCLEAALAAHPEAEADLLVSEQAAPVFARDRRFRRVIVSRLYEQRARRRLLLVLRKIREAARLAVLLGRSYDLAITFYWGTTWLNLLTRLASRGPNLGYANAWPQLLDSCLGRYRPEGDALSQAVRLMAAAGIDAAPAAPLPRPDRGETGAGWTLLGRHGLAASSRLAILHPGSDWACQQWLIERWATVADWLALELGMDVVFTGVAAEAEPIERIRSLMRASSLSLAGATSVADLAALVRRAAICVCVDSLAFELAQAAGVPSVVLAGQSRTKAYGLRPVVPIVVNRTTPELRAAILACKLSFEKASYGGCLHYGCPMAGLRGIEVEDVKDAVLKALPDGLTAQTAAGARS
jgi:ADP-heptose:LPS heptosyltransferase